MRLLSIVAESYSLRYCLNGCLYCSPLSCKDGGMRRESGGDEHVVRGYTPNPVTCVSRSWDISVYQRVFFVTGV